MITLDPSHPSGPAEQIRGQLTALIQSGELVADLKLPPVRQLAGDLRVAPGTVAKAYKDLEEAGLVRTGRANGTRVNPGMERGVPALKEVQRLVTAARTAGMSLAEVQGLVAITWNALNPVPTDAPRGS